MANYSEDGLDKLLKKDLVSIILSQQKKNDQDNIGWFDEIRKLEADVKNCKKNNNLLLQ